MDLSDYISGLSVLLKILFEILPAEKADFLSFVFCSKKEFIMLVK